MVHKTLRVCGLVAIWTGCHLPTTKSYIYLSKVQKYCYHLYSRTILSPYLGDVLEQILKQEGLADQKKFVLPDKILSS